jgi:hypothetical protein
MSEPGTAAAIAHGIAIFVLLAVVGCLVGVGLLTLLRCPGDLVRRVLVAPFAATVVWALPSDVLVQAGFTMRQITPWIGVMSLALAIVGLVALARDRRRAWHGVAIVGTVALVIALPAWPFFAHGLAAHVGSPNTDNFLVTGMAAAFWHHGLEAAADRTPYYTLLTRWVVLVGPARNSHVLNALFSPLVQAGEAMFVRNLFVCWSLFSLACALAFYRATWEGQDRRPPLRVLAAYVLLTIGLGWTVVPALVGNWDNQLLTSLGPALAGLAAEPLRGIGQPLLLAAFVAYGTYTYPEVTPFVVLFAIPLFLRPAETAPRRRRIVALAVVVGIGALLIAPGATDLWQFFERQRGAAAVTTGIRPGGAFAGSLVTHPANPAVWWTLGAEYNLPLGPVGTACGVALTGLALVGVIQMWRRRRWAELASLALLGAAVGYFVFVDHYGYGAYKLLSVACWLVGRCLIEGCAAVLATSRPVPGVAGIKRVRWAGAAAALTVLLLASLAVTADRRLRFYSPRAIYDQQPTLAAIARLQSAAGPLPAMDVLIDKSLSGPYSLPWIIYALKDTRLRPYHATEYFIPGGETWKATDPLPQSVLLHPDLSHTAGLWFRTPEFALVSTKSMALVERIESPNGFEGNGTWLGTRPVTITFLAPRGGRFLVVFDAAPGPSLTGTPRRTLVFASGSREVGRHVIVNLSRVVFPFVASGGREVVTLSTTDRPNIGVLPNGDTRTLLVGLWNLKLIPQNGTAPSSP